jgi:hypothetical protein
VEVVAYEPVSVVPSGLEADLVCALLRTEGIECFSRKTDFAAAASAGLESGGPHEVVVARDDDLPRARELVAAQGQSRS